MTILPSLRLKEINSDKNNKPYTFLGTNFWYGMNLGSKGSGGNRKDLF
jgi:mannan endo-1,4-beta-mannosidase